MEIKPRNSTEGHFWPAHTHLPSVCSCRHGCDVRHRPTHTYSRVYVWVFQTAKTDVETPVSLAVHTGRKWEEWVMVDGGGLRAQVTACDAVIPQV